MNWYGAVTKPTKEPLADHKLRVSGFRTFFPHYPTKWRPESKRLSTLYKRPYFPRYLFVHADEGDVHRINGIEEVQGVLTSAGLPFAFPLDVMVDLFAVANPQGEVFRNVPKLDLPRFPGDPGDEMTFPEGHAFWGLTALIMQVVGVKARVRLEMMFGAPREMIVGLQDVGEIREAGASP